MLQREPFIVVVMGVTGSGKSTVGAKLAARLSCEFVEGDTLHPPENIERMARGVPLDDQSRAPWLAAIAGVIDRWRAEGRCGVVSSSALKRRYRDTIIGTGSDVRLVYLEGSRPLLRERIAARTEHFMPAALLDSQLDALEEPAPDEHAIVVSIEQPIEREIDQIVRSLNPTA